MRPARHGNVGNQRPVGSGADDVWQDLPPVTVGTIPTFPVAGMRTPEPIDSPVVDVIGRFAPPSAGIELQIDVFGCPRELYGQA